MEIGDVFVINKADREGALRTERELELLASTSQRADGWTPPIIKSVATEDKGTGDLVASIADFEEFIASQDERSGARRARVAEHRIIELLRDRLLKVAMSESVTEDELREMASAVADRRRDPYSVVEEIIATLGIGP
jgi:LAO/AO transport system kinase